MNKGAKIGLYVLGGTVVAAAGLVAYGKIRNKTLLAQINKVLDADPGSTTNTQAAIDALTPYYFTNQGYTDFVNSKDNSHYLMLNSAPYPTALLGTTADSIAKAIHDAHNVILPNDQSTIMKEIGVLATKIKVSYIAKRFKDLYGQDLQQFLHDTLSTDNYNLVANTIANMPIK